MQQSLRRWLGLARCMPISPSKIWPSPLFSVDRVRACTPWWRSQREFPTGRQQSDVKVRIVRHPLTRGATTGIQICQISRPFRAGARRADVSFAYTGNGDFVFQLRETGGQPIKLPILHGFDSTTLTRSIIQDLQGKAESHRSPDVECTYAGAGRLKGLRLAGLLGRLHRVKIECLGTAHHQELSCRHNRAKK